MTGKEIILSALKREETPRPAWIPFVGVHGAQITNVSARDYLCSSDLIVQGLLRANELYRPDALPVSFDLQLEAEILGCDLHWSDESPPSVTAHPLDGAGLESLPPYNPNSGRLPQVFEALRTLKGKIGDEVAFYGLITGPFTLALHLMGNNIFLEMFDREDHVKEVLAFCAGIGKQTATAYLENGADVIAVVDPMTSQISPKHFEQFVTPYIDSVFDHIREQGSLSSIFVCGDATRNLKVMSQTHCDNISVDENISLEELKQYGEQYGKSIGGNLKLTVALLLGSEDDAKLDAIRCIETCGNQGFVLAPGCDIPWGVPEKNLQAVANMLHDDYQREVASRTITAKETDAYDDVKLPDYANEPNVLVEIITLDSTSCAPCQYMLAAARQAAEEIGGKVVVKEHKIKTRDGIGRMVKLGLKNIPTICIDGEAAFISILPDRVALMDAIQQKIQLKQQG